MNETHEINKYNNNILNHKVRPFENVSYAIFRKTCGYQNQRQRNENPFKFIQSQDCALNAAIKFHFTVVTWYSSVLVTGNPTTNTDTDTFHPSTMNKFHQIPEIQLNVVNLGTKIEREPKAPKRNSFNSWNKQIENKMLFDSVQLTISPRTILDWFIRLQPITR